MTEATEGNRGRWWTTAARRARKQRRANWTALRAAARRATGKPTRSAQLLTAVVDVWLLACVASVVYGMGQMHAPAGWIVAGVLGAGLAWLYEYGGRQP